MKRSTTTAAFIAFVLFVCASCSPEPDDCSRYDGGTVKLSDQTLMKQIVAKDTMKFMMDDTLRIFARYDSTFTAKGVVYADKGPCGTEYYPERITVRYRLGTGSSSRMLQVEQVALYPEGQSLNLAFYQPYSYYQPTEMFSFDPLAKDLHMITEFTVGDSTYKSTKIIPSDAKGYLFISDNGELLEIRTSDGKIYTKAN